MEEIPTHNCEMTLYNRTRNTLLCERNKCTFGNTVLYPSGLYDVKDAFIYYQLDIICYDDISKYGQLCSAMLTSILSAIYYKEVRMFAVCYLCEASSICLDTVKWSTNHTSTQIERFPQLHELLLIIVACFRLRIRGYHLWNVRECRTSRKLTY